MKKTILAVSATLVLAATAMGQKSYNFPSPWNPAGKPANQVTQYVLYTWDDNGYSGMAGTEYEWRVNPDSPITNERVEGLNPGWGSATNNGGIFGDTNGSHLNTIGMVWAYRALADGQAIT